MRKLRVDPSWDGKGGIGRFYNEMFCRLNGVEKLSVISFPASPLSTIYYSIQSLFYSSTDVFIYFGYIPPLFSRQKFIFVIYDLNHIDVPHNSSFLKRLFYNFIIKPGCYRAEKIITISDFSKNRIVEWSGIDKNKVINVNCGVSDIFFDNNFSYGCSFDYIFCPSNRKKHKNEERLILAFSEIYKNHNLNLIFTGEVTDDLKKLLENLNIIDRVHFMGYVNECTLATLYKGAKLTVFPSLYEGFGLPVLESMASGTPVVTSDIGATKEVSGDCALLVDPLSVEDISRGISTLLNSEELMNKYSMAGIEKARFYNWEKCSSDLIKVLKNI
ncbi:glycosyltransferase family 4 protein [Marinomonas shanghaiensis]|uniref:glycosyltransferase family 4 protein n=1 Tax=Marinomonas shanghaiensis TaxID=2202418 RepID=UPI003A8D1463